MRGLTVFVIHAYTATVEAIYSNETRKVLWEPLNFFHQICLAWSLQWSFLYAHLKNGRICRGNVRPSVRYYTSKQMYNWMKWLRLLGGWHFIAATAIKPPKAACQFAADDILLYEFCYYNPMDLLHHLEKGKEELSPLQYHIKSLHIISRHYKKSLLRSQIYHGYEDWRIIYGHKLPYMKKTRKKKQVCGAACFMAAEIKFSKDVRVFQTFLQHALRYQFETWYKHSVGGTTCRVWVASQLGHFDLV